MQIKAVDAGHFTLRAFTDRSGTCTFCVAQNNVHRNLPSLHAYFPAFCVHVYLCIIDLWAL